MRKEVAVGFTVLELMVVICIAGLLASLWLPRAARLMDWLETERARRDMTTALAVARHGAVLVATRSRLTIRADTLRIDRLEAVGWVPWWRWPGPSSHAVSLEVSNPVVVFGPNGMGWGASNTRIVLRRGSQAETITVSRVGRVKIW
jgi:Tfp pilus assembly protein FimT